MEFQPDRACGTDTDLACAINNESAYSHGLNWVGEIWRVLREMQNKSFGLPLLNRNSILYGDCS